MSKSIAATRLGAGVVVLAAIAVSSWYASPGGQVVQVTPLAAPVAVAPPAAAPAPSSTAPTSKKPTKAPAKSVPISPGGGTSLAPQKITPGSPGSTVPLTPGGSTADTPTGTFAAVPLAEQPACPLGWPKPERSGGLSSIVELAPMFGPFSSEVFALGSAMQPVMQLAGPVLAEIEPIIHQNMPWISPLLDQVQAVEAVVLEAILPFYGPFRSEFIQAESGIGAALTPILTKIYQTPAAACLVAWEGQIISAAKGKPITVASLSRPGQQLTLGARR